MWRQTGFQYTENPSLGSESVLEFFSDILNLQLIEFPDRKLWVQSTACLELSVLFPQMKSGSHEQGRGHELAIYHGYSLQPQ